MRGCSETLQASPNHGAKHSSSEYCVDGDMNSPQRKKRKKGRAWFAESAQPTKLAPMTTYKLRVHVSRVGTRISLTSDPLLEVLSVELFHFLGFHEIK